MDVLRTIIAVVLFLTSVGLIAVILLQKSKGEGLGSIGGGGHLFHGVQSSYDIFLSKLTTYIAIVFMALAVLASAIDIFV